ncbi:MAG: DUF998 domain-containing protein [candidate division WOR-3 bacterium]|nr:MAG: DUF998 domain-containing protein [candidate division WOR-3 bacterium]
MNGESRNETSLVYSYLELRRIIGLLGILFPFILALGALIFFSTGPQSSVSAYYHTGMRDVFVGILFAIGFFLLTYRGYERSDNRAGNLCCIFAIGVALFPCTPDVGATNTDQIIGYFHLAFAALFFLTLIYFSLRLFTKTDPDKPPSSRKIQRNRVYKVCGYAMLICILLIAVYIILPDSVASAFEPLNPIYWLEALAVLFFGISWFTKGEAILKDEE